MKYNNGIITQQKILDTCRKLFYEKGFKNTTYALICSEANINPGTLLHHFSNKLNIATLIYKQAIDEYSKVVHVNLYNESALDKALVGLGLHIKALYYDDSYRLFSSEYLSEKAFAGINLKSDFNLSPAAYAIMHERMNEQKQRFYNAAFSGMNGNIETYINNHIDEIELEDAIKYYLEFTYLFIETDELNKHIDKTLYLLTKFTVQSSYFDIKIKFN